MGLAEKNKPWIPYGRQSIDESDIAAVVDVLRSDWITQGEKVQQFEREIAAYTGSEYAIASNSGSSALYIACRALGLEAGDILWTSAMTFAASANCGALCGADVDFVDIDPETANLSVLTLEGKFERAKRNNRLPKVLVAVCFAGQPYPLKTVYELAKRYGCYVINDASHALGATYDEKTVGATYADITVFSFHPVKMITTAEGGMAVTNCQHLAEKMQLLVSHGITKHAPAWERQEESNKEISWYYEQSDLSSNFRLTDIQCALGSSQLLKLDDFVAQRRFLGQRYDDMLREAEVYPLRQKSDGKSSYHLYVIRIREVDPVARRTLFECLRKSGIGANVHYIPVYWHPYYQRLGFAEGYCPEAEKFYQRALSLPLFPQLTEQQQDYIVETLTEALV